MARIRAEVTAIHLAVVPLSSQDSGVAGNMAAEAGAVCRRWQKAAVMLMNFVVSVRLRAVVDVVDPHCYLPLLRDRDGRLY